MLVSIQSRPLCSSVTNAIVRTAVGNFVRITGTRLQVDQWNRTSTTGPAQLYQCNYEIVRTRLVQPDQRNHTDTTRSGSAGFVALA